MNTRAVVLSVLMLTLVGVWLWFFSGLFSPGNQIPIVIQPRPARISQSSPDAVPVVFGLDRDYTITSIKVESLEGSGREPLWHVESDTGSERTRAFFYAQKIRGMTPAVEDAQPGPLEPGVKYRITIQAEGKTGRLDFSPQPRAAPTGR
jgi:hypothetical protein